MERKMNFMKVITSKLYKNLDKTNKSAIVKCYCNISRKPPWKVLFFGTDDFSVFSLQALYKEYRKGILLNKLEVVTTLKGKANAVKMLCERKKLQLHEWPPDISYGEFDVGLVVSFGHLIPEYIIDKFEFGMLNVHASLLPRWRGAAPVIYAIANGDTQTGITIMKISPKKFDIGEIVCQEATSIYSDMKVGELYQKLGLMGAANLIKTLTSLPYNLKNAHPQPTKGITYAPKINPSFACIDWNTMSSEEIYNRARALDGIFHLQTTWKGIPVKLAGINRDNIIAKFVNLKPGTVLYDKTKNHLRIVCSDLKFITVNNVGVSGKKNMTAKDFNNGYLKKEHADCRRFK